MNNKRTFIVTWSSPGNITSGKQVVISADNIVQAQDKFWTWLRKQPVFQHMWKLNFEMVECESVNWEVVE